MYLDPGFGSMVVQVVVACIAAAGAVLFMVRSRIKAFFQKGKAKDTDKSAEDSQTPTGE